MIIYEEKAFERILFAGFCDTAIPISVRIEKDGDTLITALPSLKREAREFEKLFFHDPLSDKAHAWLKEKLCPFMYEHGFKANRQSRKITDIYVRPTLEVSGLDRGDSVLLTSPQKNATTADIESLLKFGHIASAVVREGTVVSVAYTDLAPDFDTAEIEVGIETAPAYRGRGLARAALSGLICELAHQGITPVYVTSRGNRASQRLARTLGFVKEAVEYNFVFRRI